MDPPLTALPTGLWMCPNHPEHFIDWKLVTSISATERVKLWDQFSGPVDQETVKLDFLRRVHRKNPPYRIKLKPKPRFCAEIPPMVEYHYKHPPPLIPSLRDVLRCENVYKHGFRYEPTNKELCEQLDDDLRAFEEAKRKLDSFENHADDDCKAEDVIDDQVETAVDANDSDIAKIPLHSGEDEKREGGVEIESIETQETVVTQDIEMNNDDGEPKENGIADDMNKTDEDDATVRSNEHARTPKRKRISSVLSCGTNNNLDDLDIPRKIIALREEKTASNMIDGNRINIELDHLDASLIKQLAFQQLQQILSENSELVAKYQTESANNAIKDALRIKPKKITLPSQMLSKEDIARIVQEFARTEKADAPPQENGWADHEGATYPVFPFQLPPSDGILYTNGLNHISDEAEMAQAIAQRLQRPLLESKVRARAVLTPVDDILRRKR